MRVARGTRGVVKMSKEKSAPPKEKKKPKKSKTAK
jgi:hypothetical protein